MRNSYLDQFYGYVKVRVCGLDIYRFLLKVMRLRISIKRVIPISYKEVHLVIRYSDLDKIKSIYSVLYDVSVLEYLGNLSFKKKMRKNSILILFSFLGIICLFCLSFVIFSVDVVHEDLEMRELILSEVQKYGISKYTFRKSYNEIEKIEEKILNDYRDRLEWIEISHVGTKYIVRLEERKISFENESTRYQNIISKKEAVVRSIRAVRGEKLVHVNDYVKKGDIIISGCVTLPSLDKVFVRAEGEVLGEVWYSVKIDYPFVYHESFLTGRTKSDFAFYFLHHRFGIFNRRLFRTFSTKNKILFSSMLLNSSFVFEKQYETKVIDEINTEDIVLDHAIDYVSLKMKKDNSDISDFISFKVLNYLNYGDGVSITFFVRVLENIAEVSYFDDN